MYFSSSFNLPSSCLRVLISSEVYSSGSKGFVFLPGAPPTWIAIFLKFEIIHGVLKAYWLYFVMLALCSGEFG